MPKALSRKAGSGLERKCLKQERGGRVVQASRSPEHCNTATILRDVNTLSKLTMRSWNTKRWTFVQCTQKTAMSFNVTTATLPSASKVAFSKANRNYKKKKKKNRHSAFFASNTIPQTVQKSSKSAKKPTPSPRCAIPLKKWGKKIKYYWNKRSLDRIQLSSMCKSEAINKTKTFGDAPPCKKKKKKQQCL